MSTEDKGKELAFRQILKEVVNYITIHNKNLPPYPQEGKTYSKSVLDFDWLSDHCVFIMAFYDTWGQFLVTEDWDDLLTKYELTKGINISNGDYRLLRFCRHLKNQLSIHEAVEK